MSEQGLAYVSDMTVRADKLQHTTSKEITMYYRIKNCIIYLPCVITAEAAWADGCYAILINLTGAKHVTTITFLSKEERDAEFNALCDELLKQETM